MKVKPHGSFAGKILVFSSAEMLEVSIFFVFVTYGVVLLLGLLLGPETLHAVLLYVGKPRVPKRRPSYLLLHHLASGLLA